MFYEMYNSMNQPLSCKRQYELEQILILNCIAVAMSCLVQLASARRTLFTNQQVRCENVNITVLKSLLMSHSGRNTCPDLSNLSLTFYEQQKDLINLVAMQI